MTPKNTPDPYLECTPEQLRAEAEGWRDAIYLPGELGYCYANAATWRYDPHYPVSKLLHLLPDQWLEWFRQEQVEAADDGREGYYDSMLARPISDAIIVLERDGKGYIWDGWHRTGAAVTKNLTTLRAIVGFAQD